MEYRRLGNTDIEVSEICLGTMTFGEQNSEEDAHEQLNYAIDNDVNFIDTAEMYAVPARPETQGLTERYIGSWLANRKKRDDVVIATKIAGPGPYTAHIRKADDYSRQSIIEAVEGSLKRLRTDYIDLYQLHWPARRANFFGVKEYRHHDAWQDNFHDILQVMDELIKAGKIRCFGLSNETPWGVMNFLHIAAINKLPRCVSVQNPYNLLNRTYEIGLAEISIREQVGLLAYSPMAFGRLSGKYVLGMDKPENRINQFEQMSRYNAPQSIVASRHYLKVAQQYNLSLAQMSLAWVNQQRCVTSNIIGATNMTQLRENIDSVNITLSKQCVKDINAVQELIPNPAP